jgi:phosphoglycerate dehydrogenase-like enzyme
MVLLEASRLRAAKPLPAVKTAVAQTKEAPKLTSAKRTFKLVYLGEVSEGLADRLSQAAPGVTVVATTTTEAAIEHVADAEVIAGSGRLFDAHLVDSSPRLRWVQAMSAGAERFCPALAARPDVILTNVRGAHPIPIAEHFLAMLLGLTHRIPEFLAQQANRKWQRLTLHEVRGKTLLVMGLGNLGREIVAAATAIGLNVVGYDPYLAVPAAVVHRLYRVDQLAEALGTADFVVSCIPLTPANQGFIGKSEFAAMRRGTYFFNVSRGGVVDETALVNALQSGHLAGAGLDVFAKEPLPAESPLWAMGNVIITPHIAAASPETEARTHDILVENLRRYATGQVLLNQVDIKRGF